MKKSVSPLIATILLVAVALAIAGILWSWSQTFAQSQTNRISDASTLQLDCTNAAIQLVDCSYSNNTAKVRVNSIGGLDLNDFTFYVVDTTDKTINGNVIQNLKAGGLIVIDSSKLSNSSDFSGLSKPLTVRVTPKQCPERYAETAKCS